MLEKAFAHHAGPDEQIDLADMQRALGLRSEYIARRMLQLFDRNGDGVVNREEFLEGVRALIFGSDRDKLLFAFRLHDHDGDGALEEQELLRMIAISIAESDVVERPTQTAEQLARALLSLADRNRDGRVTFDELEAVVRQRPQLLHQMTRSEAIWIAPNEDLLHWLDARDKGDSDVGGVTIGQERGWAPRVVVALWVVANVALFAYAMWGRARSSSPISMQIGHALSRCIDLDGALILVPMMRRLLTRVRATWLGRVLPVDDAIDFHRIVGHALFALSVAHGAAYTSAYASGHAPARLAHLFATQAGLTGGLLLVVFAVMWLFSLAFIRRTRHFELFYFTHLLYVAWLGLAIAHAPSFAAWVGVPLLGFGVEQMLRWRRRGPASAIMSCQALRSGVTRLEVAKPPGFTFGPGDYAFLRIPAIARHEWHPFTMSSAPERDDLVFHARSLGNWTGALRRLAERTPAATDASEAPPLVAYVDGPYGSPSAHVFGSRYAVLIGAGIGVTPFASVLESIVLRGADGATRPMQLERVHFFWVNRDQYSFEWFGALLKELETKDLQGLLEVHLCMTGARTGAAALGLEVAREAMRSVGRTDFITGLRTHTHLGVPNWEAMLRLIAQRHAPDRVDVYFCGPPGLAAKLRPICERLAMSFREERF
jgi:Ca2+-binding EF-hand superfamily protein/ferredoxin-NADP reductase